MVRGGLVPGGVERVKGAVVGHSFSRGSGGHRGKPGVGRALGESSSHGFLRHRRKVQPRLLGFCREFVREVDVQSSHNTQYTHMASELFRSRSRVGSNEPTGRSQVPVVGSSSPAESLSYSLGKPVSVATAIVCGPGEP